MGKHMRAATRLAKSYTIDPEVDEYVSKTRGQRSASARVNELLTRAMKQEQYEKLAAEAEAFFSSVGDAERQGTRAFQSASIRSITRD